MKLKKRIKSALAAFLREELLEYIGYRHELPYSALNNSFRVENIEFDTMVMEHVINLHGMDDEPMYIEREIDRCRRQFANEVLQHIHVDAQDLVSPEFAMRRMVRFTLRVQRKK
jgi:hypothetical protein